VAVHMTGAQAEDGGGHAAKSRWVDLEGARLPLSVWHGQARHVHRVDANRPRSTRWMPIDKMQMPERQSKDGHFHSWLLTWTGF